MEFFKDGSWKDNDKTQLFVSVFSAGEMFKGLKWLRINKVFAYRNTISKYCWGSGHNLNFHQAKSIFKTYRILDEDFSENIAIHLDNEVILNEKNRLYYAFYSLEKLFLCL